jgi:hypothetical protein
MSNPLRRPKPTSGVLESGRFYATTPTGKLARDIGFRIYLTDKFLWLSPDLSIPLDCVTSAEVKTEGVLPPRHFLDIKYINPITRGPEQFGLCKFDGIGVGLYRRKPIERIAQIMSAHSVFGDGPIRYRSVVGSISSDTGPSSVVDASENIDDADVGLVATLPCEVCGERPSYYAAYFYLVSLLVISFRSGVVRRIHCKRHHAIHTTGNYLLTALTGWIGVGIFGYPLAVFQLAKNFVPSLGKPASLVLGVLPTLLIAGVIIKWVL